MAVHYYFEYWTKHPTFESDHIHWNEDSSVYEKYGILASDAVSTTSPSFELSSIDDFSYLSITLDTHGLALYTYFHPLIFISSSRSKRIGINGTSHYGISVPSSEVTANDGVWTCDIPLTDTIKSKYKTVFSNICSALSSSGVYLCLDVYWSESENDSGDIWDKFKELDIYKIAFR